MDPLEMPPPTYATDGHAFFPVDKSAFRAAGHSRGKLQFWNNFCRRKKLCVGRWQVNGNTRDSADRDRPDPTEINQRSASVPQRLSLVAYFDMKSSALCLD